MTDLTPIFNEALKKHNAPPITKKPFSAEHLDGFLQEAYKINSRITVLNDFLKANRQSYLSTAPPPRRTHLRAESESSRSQPQYLSPKERDQIDAEAKNVLREANKAIRELADTEQLRQNTEEALMKKKYGSRLGGLANWAAGGIGQSKSPEQSAAEGKANTVKEHRENVLFLLRLRLQQAGELQAGMMETRIMRELERNKSVLYKARGRMGQELGEPPVPAFEYQGGYRGGEGVRMEQQSQHATNIEDELTPQQLQMFEKENQDMVRHYEETLNQVKTAEKSLVEISELQTQLVQNLATQSEHIDMLVADSHLTAENVGGGNKELKKASERKSTAKYVFYATCAGCLFLVGWDLII